MAILNFQTLTEIKTKSPTPEVVTGQLTQNIIFFFEQVCQYFMSTDHFEILSWFGKFLGANFIQNCNQDFV